MASAKLLEIMRDAEMLPIREQLELIAHLASRLWQNYDGLEEPKPRPKWSDIRGAAPYPLTGEEDAQAWVSRTRRESDEHRHNQIYGKDEPPKA